MIERGAIHWVDLGDAQGSRPAKRRPVLVIQADPYNASGLITTLAVVITSNIPIALAASLTTSCVMSTEDFASSLTSDRQLPHRGPGLRAAPSSDEDVVGETEVREVRPSFRTRDGQPHGELRRVNGGE